MTQSLNVSVLDRLEPLEIAAVNIDELVPDSVSITLDVAMLDRCSILSGNKYFKLKYNLVHALEQGCRTVISFGGAYSNHIHALAIAGAALGLHTVGVIRGEIIRPLNTTLADAEANGMTLVSVSRQQYREKDESEFLRQLRVRWPNAYLIPEGGGNRLGIQGCRDIVNLLGVDVLGRYDMMALPCGTGATLAGLSMAVPDSVTVKGFSVLKNAGALERDVRRFRDMFNYNGPENWSVCHDYHMGGYARVTTGLMSVIDTFTALTSIPVEPVYTGKMVFGLISEIRQQHIPPGTRILALHTGGLQGGRSGIGEIQRQNNDELITEVRNG